MALNPTPLINFEKNYRFRTKHQSFEGTAARLYTVWNRTANGTEPAQKRWRAGLNALRQIVLDAEAAGVSVRAYGGAWSLSDAAYTKDFLVNTKPLNYLSIGLRPAQVLPEEVKNAKRYVFAQCGIHVMELQTALEAANLALPTSGASNGQTLAGAIATGTHGAAVQVGSMQDFVRGIHLVVEGGRHVYLEPRSRPVVSEAFVATLGAELIRDDELFWAALVSFGSFGLVHAFLVEAVPLYELQKFRFRVDHSTAMGYFDLDFARIAAANQLPPANPYHFEMVFDPYSGGAGKRGAYVTVMYQLPPKRGAPAAAPAASSGGWEPGDDVLQVLGALTDATSLPVPLLVSRLVEGQLSLVHGSRATPGKTFSSTSIRGSVLSAELGVALSTAQGAVEALIDEANRQSFVGLIATRFVRSSRATLAFTRFEPTTCTIELPGTGGQSSLNFFAAAWARLDRQFLPFTLHFGQCGDFTRERVARMHPTGVGRWLAARHRLLSSAGLRTFSNPFLERIGLAG